ncbi:Bestrophin, RFP-TM, chloride channel-domain-containing protein [Thelonectria olida]|uniref:Bestrophin, RFP-TM, chloride channel-domain-containing protein n=1 Tax=Thelonectria olida TaxID=1576542 RepID=A0A9P9ASF2_9HYPO|nr:Bestrophin, RFP-TM, chloride channel-domain-containing protein [Thelonectria olida]
MADANPVGTGTNVPGTTIVTRPTMSTIADNDAPQQERQQNEKVDPRRLASLDIPALDHVRSPPSPAVEIDPALFRRTNTLEMEDYFTGPRDIGKHSKWPLFLQMHGSIIPKLILPLLLIGGWATAITVISKKVHKLDVDSVLLTILGFVVGLSLSFRSSTAYERYAEGRRFWGSLTLASQALGRTFWIHTKDDPNPDRDNREVIIEKLSAMNLLVAFSIALKHKLRFEPYSNYPDIHHLIGHLNTFAKNAIDSSPDLPLSRRKSFFKEVGEYLGVSFAASNPRKALKRTNQHLGNLPLEILNHISVILDKFVSNQQLTVPMHQTVAYNHITIMNDVMVGCERVLNTPLPIAYTIAISQITGVYVVLLPFQLVGKLGWVAIPATVAAAYIIFGLLFIGQEIENPFGLDVNDLPLENFCDQIATDLDLISAFDKHDSSSFIFNRKNMPLYPVSSASAGDWMKRSDEKLRATIKEKPKILFDWRRNVIDRQEAELAAKKRHVSVRKPKAPVPQPKPVQIQDIPEDDESQDYVPQTVNKNKVSQPQNTPGDHNV